VFAAERRLGFMSRFGVVGALLSNRSRSERMLEAFGLFPFVERPV
jgi:hypothetical protein